MTLILPHKLVLNGLMSNVSDTILVKRIKSVQQALDAQHTLITKHTLAVDFIEL